MAKKTDRIAEIRRELAGPALVDPRAPLRAAQAAYEAKYTEREETLGRLTNELGALDDARATARAESAALLDRRAELERELAELEAAAEKAAEKKPAAAGA